MRAGELWHIKAADPIVVARAVRADTPHDGRPAHLTLTVDATLSEARRFFGVAAGCLEDAITRALPEFDALETAARLDSLACSRCAR